jgi:hypothetical protein
VTRDPPNIDKRQTSNSNNNNNLNKGEAEKYVSVSWCHVIKDVIESGAKLRAVLTSVLWEYFV